MAAFGPSQSVSPNAAMAWRHDSEEFLVQQPEGPVYDKLLGVVSWADFKHHFVNSIIQHGPTHICLSLIQCVQPLGLWLAQIGPLFGFQMQHFEKQIYLGMLNE